MNREQVMQMMHMKRDATPRSERRRHRLVGLARKNPCELVTETDTRYLDQDGDGLLDAVELTITRVAAGPDFRRVLGTERLLLAGVGDDGVPHFVTVRPAA